MTCWLCGQPLGEPGVAVSRLGIVVHGSCYDRETAVVRPPSPVAVSRLDARVRSVRVDVPRLGGGARVRRRRA